MAAVAKFGLLSVQLGDGIIEEQFQQQGVDEWTGQVDGRRQTEWMDL